MSATYIMSPWHPCAPGGLDGRYSHHLPDLVCRACGRRYGDPYVEYPLTDLTDLPNGLTEAMGKALSSQEFERLADQLLKLHGRQFELVPGAEIGRYSGTVTGVVADFAWGTSWSLFVKPAILSVLRDLGIELMGAPIALDDNHQAGDTYLAIFCEPASLLDEATRNRLTISRCSTCGQFYRRRLGRTCDPTHTFVRKQWPAGSHIVRLREHSSFLVVSEQFMSVCLARGISGVAFEAVGHWDE